VTAGVPCWSAAGQEPGRARARQEAGDAGRRRAGRPGDRRAGTGTSYRLWLGLQRLNALGGQPTREAYEADLSYWLQLDGPDAARLAGDVVAAGLAVAGDDGLIAVSARGRALRQEVLAASAQVTGPMLATIDRADLDTTIRTLEKITRLASNTEGNR